MTKHPNSENIAARLSSGSSSLCTKVKGEVFRFVNPRFSSARDQFAGKGALYFNGRWMPKGDRLAAYASLTPETALVEALAANRYYGFPDSKSAPMILVTAEVELDDVLDLTQESILTTLGLSQSELLEIDWRKQNGAGQEALTQAWGREAHQRFLRGLLCPSAADPNGKNLVIFPQNLTLGRGLTILNEINWP